MGLCAQLQACHSSSSTVPTEHHCVLTGRRHPWVPFPVFLPLRDWQDLALDSRQALGLG